MGLRYENHTPSLQVQFLRWWRGFELVLRFVRLIELPHSIKFESNWWKMEVEKKRSEKDNSDSKLVIALVVHHTGEIFVPITHGAEHSATYSAKSFVIHLFSMGY